MYILGSVLLILFFVFYLIVVAVSHLTQSKLLQRALCLHAKIYELSLEIYCFLQYRVILEYTW